MEKMGRREDAQAFYLRAAKLAGRQGNPRTEAAAWNNLGALSCRRGNEAEARRYFERALRLDPRQADAYRNLVMLESAAPRRPAP